MIVGQAKDIHDLIVASTRVSWELGLEEGYGRAAGELDHQLAKRVGSDLQACSAIIYADSVSGRQRCGSDAPFSLGGTRLCHKHFSEACTSVAEAILDDWSTSIVMFGAEFSGLKRTPLQSAAKRKLSGAGRKTAEAVAS